MNLDEPARIVVDDYWSYFIFGSILFTIIILHIPYAIQFINNMSEQGKQWRNEKI